jgi:hypothetical protein
MRELAEHPIELDQVGERVAYGNSDGLAVLRERETLTEAKNKLESIIAKCEAELEKRIYKAEIWQVDEIAMLRQAAQGHYTLRRRFLAQLINVPSDDDEGVRKKSKAIKQGNEVAHGGDAVSDAVIYHRGERTDADQYVRIYGMSWQQVLEIGKWS